MITFMYPHIHQIQPKFLRTHLSINPVPLRKIAEMLFVTPFAFAFALFASLAATQEMGLSEIPALSESSVPNLPEASSIAAVAASSAAASAVSSILAKSSSLAAASPKPTSTSGAAPTTGE
jgi:hypothetical protein